MKTLPKQTWGEPTDQPPIYFAHANAYPPGSYLPILEALAENNQVVSYLQRPLWQPTPATSSIQSWHDLVDDVIEFFEQNNMRNVVAVGHSLGAVTTFMAAQKRPDLIKALVMIEPVALPKKYCLLTRWFPWLVKQRVTIIKKAHQRQDRFKDLQSAFEFHRRPRVFQRISDENLWRYIRAGVVEKEGVFRLAYPREWEARIYATATYFRGQLIKSTLPVLGLRGGFSDTIDVNFWSRWKSNTHHQHMDFPEAGHLLPLENPAAVIDAMQPFLAQHLS